jgi:hypothetical protein
MFNSTLIQVISLDSCTIEIHHNPLLKNKPCLVRIFDWDNNNPYEIRLNQEDIRKLNEILREYKA